MNHRKTFKVRISQVSNFTIHFPVFNWQTKNANFPFYRQKITIYWWSLARPSCAN